MKGIFQQFSTWCLGTAFEAHRWLPGGKKTVQKLWGSDATCYAIIQLSGRGLKDCVFFPFFFSTNITGLRESQREFSVLFKANQCGSIAWRKRFNPYKQTTGSEQNVSCILGLQATYLEPQNTNRAKEDSGGQKKQNKITKQKTK